MNKIIKVFGMVCITLFLSNINVLAAENAEILEHVTGEESVSVYISGIESDVSDVNVQIGTTVAESVIVQKIKDQNIPMKTLIMVDNSLSISKDNREKIASFMQDMIADRITGEQIAIAVFGENITYLVEYTDDYSTLKTAVESITYQDQETYLTDVLYELLSTGFNIEQEDVYQRIVIISDGVDNKSLGYTKDELVTLLKEKSYPIYTIGCASNNNNEQLENMFALSRMTGADYFLLNDIENTLDINTVLKQDRENIKVTFFPEAPVMDGQKKAVKISFSSKTLSADIIMPQKQMEIVKETVPEPIEEVVEPEIETQPVENDNVEQTNRTMLIVICFVVVVSVIGIVALIFLLQKRKKVTFESIEHNGLNDIKLDIPESNSKTEIISNYSADDIDNEKTCMIWNDRESYHVTLTDINSPMKSFQVPLNHSIIIGRRKSECDIALEYEKTVSGKHCQITAHDGRFYIRDLQSANKTYLNDSIVLSETEIISGNVIRMGNAQMRFEVR